LVSSYFMLCLSFLCLPRRLSSSFFPYTTLFRSWCWDCPWCTGVLGGPHFRCCSLWEYGAVHNSPSKPWNLLPPPQKFDPDTHRRSEEHTSELQSRENLVCRLLLEKKKKK